jgi:hypothetical protein
MHTRSSQGGCSGTRHPIGSSDSSLREGGVDRISIDEGGVDRINVDEEELRISDIEADQIGYPVTVLSTTCSGMAARPDRCR